MRSAQYATRNGALSKLLELEQAPKRKSAMLAATAAAHWEPQEVSKVAACPLHRMLGSLGLGTEVDSSPRLPATRPSLLDALKSLKSIVLHGQPKTNMTETWLHNFKTVGPLHRMQLSKNMDMVHAMRMEHHEKVIAAEGACPKRTNIVGWAEAMQELGKPSGIFMADGPAWLEQRALFRKLMLSPENVRKYVDMLNPVVHDFMQHLHSIRSSEDEIANLDSEMHNYSSDCILTLMFGSEVGRSEQVVANRQRLNTCVTSIFRNCLTFFYIPLRFLRATQHKYWTDFVDNFRGLFQVVESLVAEKEKQLAVQSNAEGEDHSIVGNVLRMSATDKKAVLSSIADIVGGGIDTTATAMQWSLLMLAKHPQVQQKIRDELQQVVGDGPLQLTAQHLDKLQYVKAVVKEVLRLYPVIPVVSRVLDKDVQVDQHTVQAGSQFTVVTYAAGRNEQVFENAEQFLPERWLREKASSSSASGCPIASHNVNRNATMPFGFGVRSCVGRRIAELELYLFLSHVCHKYDVQCANKMDAVKEQWQILLLPSEELRIRLKERI